MATAEEYASWIVNNQAKKGTPEFDTVAQAYRIARGAVDTSKPPVMQKLPSMGDSMREAIAADVSPLGAKIVGGIGTAVDDAAMSLKQLFGNKLSPQESANVRANRELISHGGLPAMAGNIAGNIAMTGAPAASLYRGAASLAGRALPASLAPAIAPAVGGAASGAAVSGITQPVLEGESRLTNTGAGAIGGVLGDVGARVAARAVNPIMQSAPVRSLMDRGVVPTPGQAAGGSLNQLEQKFESLPGPGNFIRMGRERSSQEFNKAALNTAMPPGQTVSKAGQEGVEQVKGALSEAYDKIFAGQTVSADAALFRSIMAAKSKPATPLNYEGEKAFNSIVKKLVAERIPQGGKWSASQVKTDIIGDLGKEAQGYLNSSTMAEKAVGQALMEARNAAQAWLIGKVSASNPSAAAQLAKLDPAYANSIKLTNAAERAKAKIGEFTPFQLQSNTRPGTPLRALASDAQSVLGNTVPNSGTIDRGLVASLLGLGGAGVNEYYGGPGYLSALALSPLLYSRAGSRYALGDLVPGQQGLASLLRQSAPYAALGGASLLDREP